jgi:hypothetical protein
MTITPVQVDLPFTPGTYEEAFAALRKDLVAEGGPQISTMRNHPFAILPYPPDREFEVRRLLQRLVLDLRAVGWVVLSIDMQQLLLDRISREGEEFRRSIIERERRLFQRDPQRALNHLTEKVTNLIEGPEGIAADVVAHIGRFADDHPQRAAQAVVFLGRLGALYPFVRSSALLKHVAHQTRGIPVVLLYPGTRPEKTGLSFMGILPPDHDYRPRIYP